MKSDNKRSIEKKSFLRYAATSSTPHRNSKQDLLNAMLMAKSNTLKFIPSKQKKKNDQYDQRKSVGSQRLIKNSKKKTLKARLLNTDQKILLQNSDKMKLFYWNSSAYHEYTKKIIISLDFIMNQDCFWVQSSSNNDLLGQKQKNKNVQNNQLIKQWKILHKDYFIIWTMRKKSSWVKLQKLIATYSLPIHAVFLVKSKRNYTLDYSSILHEIQSSKTKLTQIQNQIILQKINIEPIIYIFQTVKINIKDVVTYQSYRGRIPILFNTYVKVALMRIDNELPGLTCILSALDAWSRPQSSIQLQHHQFTRTKTAKVVSARLKNTQFYPVMSINAYIQQYLNFLKETKQSSTKQQTKQQQEWIYDEQQIQNKIQTMKKNIIQILISQNGRSYQFEGGNSIYNFVGEMFKRNYRIIYDQFVQSKYLQERNYKKTITTTYTTTKIQEDSLLNIRINYYQFEYK